MKKFYHSFLIAFSMYSKIPMPQCEWNEENMAYAIFSSFHSHWGIGIFEYMENAIRKL